MEAHERLRDEEKGPIESFSGEYRFLSNFWPAHVVHRGVEYTTVEHAYVAAKSREALQRFLVSLLPSPGKAKRHGAKMDLRDDWAYVKLDLMRNFLHQKFSDPALRELLLSTGDRQLIEGNTWKDVYWGVCEGFGANHLGRLLMEVRAELADLHGRGEARTLPSFSDGEGY